MKERWEAEFSIFFTFVTPSPCKLIGSLTKKPGARLSYFSSAQDECLFITFDQASLTLKIRDAFSCNHVPKSLLHFSKLDEHLENI